MTDLFQTLANKKPLRLIGVKDDQTPGTRDCFKIWTADTPRRDAQGLMFVREMDDHAGMLFLFPGDQRISMWMKNTYIPLDMLFVAGDGRINTIVARTTPLSLDVISAPEPAHAVLELKGGVAEQMGIKAGDTLVHPSFGNTGNLGRR